jgi:large subunit ribosomal protein L21
LKAILETGGKQYTVSEGDIIYIEKRAEEAGETVTFNTVLAILSGSKSKFGKPVLEGASVTGTLVKSGKQKKIIVYKMHPKKNYRRKQGHRQAYSKVQITKIVSA